MRNLLAALTLIAGVFPAFAADQAPPRQQQPAPQVAACSYCGFSAGVAAGYGWGWTDPEINIDPFTNPAQKGYVFGGFASYLWQYGNVVGGFRVTYDVADIKESQSVSFGEGGSIGLTSKFDALGTVMARAGFVLGNDTLIYGAGGLAYAKAKASINICEGDCLTIASASENLWGYALGGGMEYKITNNLVVGVDYSYMNFGNHQWNFALNPAFTTPVVLGIKADTSVSVVKGTLGFRF